MLVDSPYSVRDETPRTSLEGTNLRTEGPTLYPGLWWLPEKKRLPPWEEARLLFKMQEEARKRKLLEENAKRHHSRAKRVGPNTLDELEQNRKRLRELQERLEDE